MDDTVICCRVCLYQPTENDMSMISLFNANDSELSETGHLYETSLDLKIDLHSWSHYPRNICQYCTEQIKSFLQLKCKARQIMQHLQTQMEHYENLIVEVSDSEESNELEHNIVEGLNEIKIEPSDLNGQQYVLVEENYEVNDGEEKESMNEDDTLDLNGQQNVVAEDSSSASKLGYADIYQHFITRTMQKSLAEPNSNASSPPHDMEQEDNTFFITQKLFTILQQIQTDTNETDDILKTSEKDIKNANDSGQVKSEVPSTQIKENSSLLYRIATKAPNCTNVAFVCFSCSLQFKDIDELQKHKIDCHTKIFQCDKCSKILRSADALRVHKRLHDPQPLYSCDLCPRHFNQKVHYRYHMDRHNNIRKFDCKHCGKLFLSKSDLCVHVRTHFGKRPHMCSVCNKSFFTAQHLNTHKYSHLPQSFECMDCNQKFISPVTLRQHRVNIHEKKRGRFHCVSCDKRFRSKSHLSQHMDYSHDLSKKQTINGNPTINLLTDVMGVEVDSDQEEFMFKLDPMDDSNLVVLQSGDIAEEMEHIDVERH